jgi:HK97 gp10 family phage protein
MKLEFTGGPQLAKTLRGLDPAKARGVRLKMLKSAAEPMRDRMEELAPLGEVAPHVKDHIVVSAVRKIDDPDFVEPIEVADDAAAVAVGPSKDAFYGALLEFGTAPHGKHPGTPAQPFVRPGYEQTAEQALRILGEQVFEHIRKTAERSPTGRNL